MSASPVTTPEALLRLATAEFDARIDAALSFVGPEPPHDGDWKLVGGKVKTLLIKRGDSLIEIIRYPHYSNMDFAIWEFGEKSETLTLKRLRDGRLQAASSWLGPVLDVSKVPQEMLSAVADLIKSTPD